MFFLIHFLETEMVGSGCIIIRIGMVLLLENRLFLPFPVYVLGQREFIRPGQVLVQQSLGRVKGMVRVKNINIIKPGRTIEFGHLPFFLRKIANGVNGLVNTPFGKMILLIHSYFYIAHFIKIGILILLPSFEQPMAVFISAPISSSRFRKPGISNS